MASDIQLSVDLEPGDVTSAAERLQAQIEQIFNSAAGKEVSASFAQLQVSMDRAYTRAGDLRERMAQLEGTKVPTEEYTDLSNKLQELENEYNKLYAERERMENKRGFSAQSEEYIAVRDQLREVGNEYRQVKREKEQMEQSGASHIAGEETAEYQNLTATLNQVNNQMRIYIERAIEAGGVKMIPAKIGLVAVRTAIDGISNGIRLAVTGIKNLGGAFLKLNISVLKRAANAAKDLAKNLAKAATAKLSSAFKGLGSSIFHVGKSSKSAQPDMKKLLTTILKYGFGIRSFYFLFRKLRRALAEGFKNLAGYSEPFNQTISELISSLNYLKNSFAAAFAPLVSVVAPILSQFIDRMASAVNMVGQFFAALTGKKTFIQAKKLYTSYTKSTDKSTDKTQKKMEKLQRTILGFDDVNILKGPDDDSNKSNTDNYDPSTDPKNMFETVDIGNGIKDWVKKFKDMWAKADFSELGRILGEKLRDALNRIPWDKIKAVLRKIAKSIATFLNGFLEVPGLFDAIGRTLAQALNSAFEFLESFISNFHWDSLGRAIKEGILGFLNNIDWNLIYKTFRELGTGIGTTLETALDNPEIWTAIFGTFAKQINALVYAITNFVAAVNWGSLAKNIATGLNNAVETLDWDAIGQMLVNNINAVFDFWYNFVTTFDFKKFGTHIGQTLSKVIKEVNWKEGGASVGATISGLFSALAGFVESVDWAELGKSVIDFISGFFGEFDWGTVGELLSACLTALWDFLSGAIQEIDWDAVADKIPSAIGEFLDGFDWNKIAESAGTLLGAAFTAAVKIGGALWNELKEFGKNVIEGGYEGIIDKLSSVGTWVKDHVFKPFTNAFKKAFGIASPSKEMKTQGQYVAQGLLDGVTNKLKTIDNWIKTNVFDKVKNGLDKAFGIVSGVASKIKSVGEGVISGLKSGAEGKESVLTTALQKITNNMESTLDGGSWSDIGSNIISGIDSGLQSGWSWLEGTVSSLASSLYSTACWALGIQSPSRVFRDKVGKMIPAGLAIGINAESDTALDAVNDLSNRMLNNALQDIKIPPIAMGEIIPPSIGKSNQQDTNNTLNDVLEMLQYNQDAMVTRDDLAEILNDVLPDMLRRYVSFVIGDEQLARHANSGNAKLNRRFKTTLAPT